MNHLSINAINYHSLYIVGFDGKAYIRLNESSKIIKREKQTFIN